MRVLTSESFTFQGPRFRRCATVKSQDPTKIKQDFPPEVPQLNAV